MMAPPLFSERQRGAPPSGSEVFVRKRFSLRSKGVLADARTRAAK